MTLTTITRNNGYDVLDNETVVGRIVPTGGIYQWCTKNQPTFAGGEVDHKGEAVDAIAVALASA